ncbi:MAG: hypothetical protein ABIJ27_08715 [Candidatus Omnitrophota bacterium]
MTRFISYKTEVFYPSLREAIATKQSVSLHWFKKETLASGAFAKAEGNSRFIFRVTGDEHKLLRAENDNPFVD